MDTELAAAVVFTFLRRSHLLRNVDYSSLKLLQ